MNWKKLKKLEWKKLFRRDNLLVLILAGALLFVIALPTGTGNGTANEKNGAAEAWGTSQIFAGGGGQGGTGTEIEQIFSSGEGVQGSLDSADFDYAQALERRLTEALAAIEGMGQVKVMITLKASRELVVERERQESSSVTKEADAKGGSRAVETGQAQESVVYSTAGGGGGSTPYVVKTYMPEIEGVLVLAQGAESGKVKRTVTEIVQALFAVEAHKIKVVKMEAKTK